jgi:hypothetical protein
MGTCISALFFVTLIHMHLYVSKMLGTLSAVVRLYLQSSCKYVMLFDFDSRESLAVWIP